MTPLAPHVGGPAQAQADSVCSQPKGKERKGGLSRGGITTLFDVGRHEDSDGGPQEYDTGGEKSDMMVQAPMRNGFTGNVATRSATEGPLQFGRVVLDPTALSHKPLDIVTKTTDEDLVLMCVTCQVMTFGRLCLYCYGTIPIIDLAFIRDSLCPICHKV